MNGIIKKSTKNYSKRVFQKAHKEVFSYELFLFQMRNLIMTYVHRLSHEERGDISFIA